MVKAPLGYVISGGTVLANVSDKTTSPVDSNLAEYCVEKFPRSTDKWSAIGLFIGSGCAALIYEVVWFQLLELVIGSSAVSLGVLPKQGTQTLSLSDAQFAALVRSSALASRTGDQ